MEAMFAIVELLGHVRMSGKVSEEERFGSKMGRIDIPQPDGTFATQFFSGSSIYRMTPCTEEVARSVALHNVIQPVHQWEMPKALPSGVKQSAFRDGDDVMGINDDIEDDDEHGDYKA